MQTLHRSWLAFFLILAGTSVRSFAAEPNEAIRQSDAMKLFGDVVLAYRSLSSYTDGGRFTAALTLDGEPDTTVTVERLSFARPNRIDLEMSGFRLLSDGEAMFLIVPVQSVGEDGTLVLSKTRFRYMELPLPKRIDDNMFRSSKQLSHFFGATPMSMTGVPASIPQTVLLTLLTADDPSRTILDPAREVKLVLDRTNMQSIIIIDYGGARGVKLFVDPNTKLLRRIEPVFDPAELRSPFRVAIDSFGWDSGRISTNNLKDARFVFRPTEAYTRVFNVMELTVMKVPGTPLKPKK
jgi:hypothetical protein